MKPRHITDGPETSQDSFEDWVCIRWLCQNAVEHGPFIVSFPMTHGDFPVRYVSLPGGKP